jgi:hypothetical protein
MVHGNQDKIVKAINISKTVGLFDPYKAEGPLLEFDHCRYKAAIKMVIQS